MRIERLEREDSGSVTMETGRRAITTATVFGSAYRELPTLHSDSTERGSLCMARGLINIGFHLSIQRIQPVLSNTC